MSIIDLIKCLLGFHDWETRKHTMDGSNNLMRGCKKCDKAQLSLHSSYWVDFGKGNTWSEYIQRLNDWEEKHL